MVGSDDDLTVSLGQLLEEVGDDRMAEPRQRDAAVSTFITCQFPDHFRLSAGMTEHVDEVEDNDIQVKVLQRVELLQKFVSISGTVYFMIGEGVLPAITLKLCLDQWSFVEVLAFFLVLIDPKIRKHGCYLVGHQSAEDGIAGILCSGGQNTIIEVLIDVKLLVNVLSEYTPLVITEIVEYDEEYFFTLVQCWEHLMFEDFRR